VSDANGLTDELEKQYAATPTSSVAVATKVMDDAPDEDAVNEVIAGEVEYWPVPVASPPPQPLIKNKEIKIYKVFFMKFIFIIV
jgi:hypothetical protein